MFRISLWTLLCLSAQLLTNGFLSNVCSAGASASQWVIVVNGDSADSKTIANHYTHLRNIPSSNVIVLHGVPKSVQISITDFRDKILAPVLAEMDRRQLSNHVQGIAYSSDFPTAVALSPELEPNPARSTYLTPVASITGLTYLYRLVMAKNSEYLAFDNNRYAQRAASELFRFPIQTEDRDEFNKTLQEHQESKDFEKIAELLDNQLKVFPEQFPIAYLSAQNWINAGFKMKGLDRLQLAIERGWSYADFTRNDSAFESVRSESRFDTLLQSSENDEFLWTPPIGFDARRFYASNGVGSPRPQAGLSYMLSMMLAVGGLHGNKIEESIEQLTVSSKADFTRPDGTFYITSTKDVRTTCREPGFDLAIDQLKRLGFDAVISPQSIPTNKPAVLGVTMGVATFSWGTSQSKFVPGAIGDNLTSLGGAMGSPSQTKLTEYLRHGAAAASGAVHEPYSIQAKFPHPTIHASYASGLTVAEAFYSSVLGPYQLLIAGDPLCQPFTNPPRFSVRGIEDGGTLTPQTRVELVSDQLVSNVKPRSVALLINGKLKGVTPFPTAFRVSDPNMTPGVYELRFLATANSRIEERWEAVYRVQIGSETQQVVVSAPSEWDASSEQPLKIRYASPSKEAQVSIKYFEETLAEKLSASGEFEVPLDKTGTGPIRLQVFASIGTSDQPVASTPVVIQVNP